ncbi:MAG: hypothetical protein V5B38_23525 [Candidatus Accumulibacter propinquus]
MPSANWTADESVWPASRVFNRLSDWPASLGPRRLIKAACAVTSAGVGFEHLLIQFMRTLRLPLACGNRRQTE